jgi:hypothetical protein
MKNKFSITKLKDAKFVMMYINNGWISPLMKIIDQLWKTHWGESMVN